MIIDKKILAITVSLLVVTSSIIIPIVINNLNQRETVTIDGLHFNFEVFLWRDFMPVSPPNGTNLFAAVTVISSNAQLFPIQIIKTFRMRVTYQTEIWNTILEIRDVGHPEPNMVKLRAAGGPKWGPNVYVTVIVELVDQQSKSYKMTLTDQLIEATS